MSNLSESLSAVGVNWPEVMERFIEDEELYETCLLSFMEDPSFEGLASAVEKENYPAAFVFAHTLKGVSGNLGLTSLFTVVCTLVETLRSENYADIVNLYKDVCTEKENLIAILGG